MTIKINYNKSSSKKNLSNLVLFVDQKFNIEPLKKHISTEEYNYILDLLKSNDLKKVLISFDINSKKKYF